MTRHGCVPRGPRALALLVAGLAFVASAPIARAQHASALTVGMADSLRSSALGEWRRLDVYTPPSYREASRFPRRYPVLYLLDGETYFGSVVAMLQLLSNGVNGTWALPEMIVVAIHSTNRRRDFTPTRITKDPYGRPLPPGWDVTGGNPRFLEFLSKELMPRIDSTYRTAPYRVYVGHSLGGLAVLNALYTTPDLFNAYVAIDPTLWMDDQRLVRLAPAYFRRPAPARRALFIAQGNNITPYDTGTAINHLALLRLNSIIQGENRSGIRYGYRFYENEDHGSIPFLAQYDAMRWIFEGFEAHVPKAASFPGFLTEHAEGLSERLGYRVVPPAALTAFVSMLSQMPPQGIAAPRDPLARAMGTWVRDSAPDPREATSGGGETVIITRHEGGVHRVERRGGPAGDSIVAVTCTPASGPPAASAPGQRRACQLLVEGDRVLFVVREERAGRWVERERGEWIVSDDARAVQEDFTRQSADGRTERRRRRYTRLY